MPSPPPPPRRVLSAGSLPNPGLKHPRNYTIKIFIFKHNFKTDLLHLNSNLAAPSLAKNFLAKKYDKSGDKETECEVVEGWEGAAAAANTRLV